MGVSESSVGLDRVVSLPLVMTWISDSLIRSPSHCRSSARHVCRSEDGQMMSSGHLLDRYADITAIACRE